MGDSSRKLNDWLVIWNVKCVYKRYKEGRVTKDECRNVGIKAPYKLRMKKMVKWSEGTVSCFFFLFFSFFVKKNKEIINPLLRDDNRKH